MAATDDVTHMSDEEFTAWMQRQDHEINDDEEIEVGGTDDIEDEDDTDDLEEEEVTDDLEQPYTDSDDNSDDEEADDESEEDSEDDDVSTDEESDADEEQPDEDKEEAKTETQPVEPKVYKYKAAGQDYEFTEEEIKAQFGGVFAQAMDYTQKVQAIKPYRKMIDAWEQEKRTPEDMNFALDLLKGNKEAIATLLQQHQVDTLDLEVDGKPNYVPQNYGRSDVELDIAEITTKISGDPEYETTHRILTKDWDDDSWNEMTKRPVLMELLHKDVKSGVFATISPIAQKLKLQDSLRYGTKLKSDLDYYKAAAGIHTDNSNRQHMQAEENERTKKLADVQAAQVKREVTKSAAESRKAAAPTKAKAGTKKLTDYLAEDFDKMSDTEYTAWMEKKLQR